MRRRTFLKAAAVCGGALAIPSARLLGAQSSGEEPSPEASPGVFNQLGYLPDAPKLVTLHAPVATFTVRSAHSGVVVLQARPAAAREDTASGDRVQIADVSAVKTPGIYVLETDAGKSARFEIGPEVYRHALWLAMRSYYGQRCGCEVDLGGGYSHPLCHGAAEFHRSSGNSRPCDNRGGWHDAGDYGRYLVNSGIATGTLLWTWEMCNSSVRGLNLKIPESGGRVPDFLAEIKWNLDWMLSLQDADGGAWHKQTSENFCAFLMPQYDHLTSYVIGTGTAPYKSTCATADLAAVAAIAARCYGPFDDAYAKQCLDAARRAYAWAARYPNLIFKNPSGVRTGEYGDDDCRDELLWAAAELWRTTGEDQYRNAFETGLAYLKTDGAVKIKTPGWNQLSALALWTYALGERKGASAELLAQIREASAKASDELVRNSRENGYGNTMSLADYVWGSNGVAGNQSLQLMVADGFEKQDEFRQVAAANLHYLLGRNCWDLSWVTQLGRKAFEHPHHRPSGADGIAAPWPGLLSGGPNAHPSDPLAATIPKGPPMKMYRDAQAAYSMNEIAINWNAPLVFLLAAVNAG
jgi:endoglucanase